MIPTYMTVLELAERIRVHPDTIRQEIADGNLPAIQIGGYKITPQDAESWIESRRVVTPEPVDSLRDGQGVPEESRFAQLARQMEGRGRTAQATDVSIEARG